MGRRVHKKVQVQTNVNIKTLTLQSSVHTHYSDNSVTWGLINWELSLLEMMMLCSF